MDDFSDFIVQQQIDSLWYNWEDAAKRVKELNEEFDSDYHAYYFQKVVK